jgi:hypothetical protein
MHACHASENATVARNQGADSDALTRDKCNVKRRVNGKIRSKKGMYGGQEPIYLAARPSQ